MEGSSMLQFIEEENSY